MGEFVLVWENTAKFLASPLSFLQHCLQFKASLSYSEFFKALERYAWCALKGHVILLVEKHGALKVGSSEAFI